MEDLPAYRIPSSWCLVFTFDNRILIQGFVDQKTEKEIQLKKFIFFWSKIAIYLPLGLHKGLPSYRRSLQPSKENIQHFKKLNLLTFYIFVYHFCPPVSGSTTLGRGTEDVNSYLEATNVYSNIHYNCVFKMYGNMPVGLLIENLNFIHSQIRNEILYPHTVKGGGGNANLTPTT